MCVILFMLLLKHILLLQSCFQEEDLMDQSRLLMILENLMIGFDKILIQKQQSCHGGTMGTKLLEWPTEQSLLITTLGITLILRQLGEQWLPLKRLLTKLQKQWMLNTCLFYMEE